MNPWSSKGRLGLLSLARHEVEVGFWRPGRHDRRAPSSCLGPILDFPNHPQGSFPIYPHLCLLDSFKVCGCRQFLQDSYPNSPHKTNSPSPISEYLATAMFHIMTTSYRHLIDNSILAILLSSMQCQTKRPFSSYTTRDLVLCFYDLLLTKRPPPSVKLLTLIFLR